MSIQELENKARQIRRNLLTMIFESKAGHTGGDLSCADIMVALYYDVMRIRPTEPNWPGRDYFVLSKGHCAEVYYAILADLGFFPFEELKTFMGFGSRLIGHPTNKVPGIEINTGALGHGLSAGVGMALGLKMDEKPNRVYVLMGDGEQGEGSIYEAAMAASHYGLDNLTAIIDRNYLQIAGNTEDVIKLEPLDKRWEAFGWQVQKVDGHDIKALLVALKDDALGKPRLLIAETVKGKGVAEMENEPKWHHGVPDRQIYESAMKQLEDGRPT